jgi:hypothetical protein
VDGKNIMKTYNFGTHWVTTDAVLEGYIDAFEVTVEEVVAIKNGANLEVFEGELEIEQ